VIEFIPIISLHADPATPSGAETGGGTHAYLRELLFQLPLRGRQCFVITRWSSPELSERQTISDFARVQRVQVGEIAPLDKKHLDGLHSTSLSAVRNAMMSCGHKVRIIHSVYWNSGRVAMDLSHELGVPFVHTVISNGRRRLLAGAKPNADRRLEVEAVVFEAATRIISVSAAERDDLISLYGIDARKIVVVGRPVDLAFRRPAHDELGRPGEPFPRGPERNV
jgi:D-inositol-3-phosphate glycosyltransferase